MGNRQQQLAHGNWEEPAAEIVGGKYYVSKHAIPTELPERNLFASLVMPGRPDVSIMHRGGSLRRRIVHTPLDIEADSCDAGATQRILE